VSVTIVKLSTSNTGIVASAIMERSITSHLLEEAVLSVTSDMAAELGVSGAVNPSAAAASAAERLSDSPALAVGFEVVTKGRFLRRRRLGDRLVDGDLRDVHHVHVMYMAGDILSERRP
jgi:hypothetical protein